MLPFSGATGAYGPDMKKAAEIVVKMVNDGGGLLGGRKLRLFIEDTETNPTVAVAATMLGGDGPGDSMTVGKQSRIGATTRLK